MRGIVRRGSVLRRRAGARLSTVSSWPFAVSSPWNMPIHNSATYQASNGSNQTFNLALQSFTCGINASSFSIKLYTAVAGDPTWDILWIDSHDLSNTNRGHFSVKIPAAATPAGGEPVWAIIDPDGINVHEMWEVTNVVAGVSAQVGFYCKTSLLGSALGSGNSSALVAGPRAYGGSMIGGLIRQYDVNQGAIKHALALAVDTTQLKASGTTQGNCTGWVWPACSQDQSACTTFLYTGQNPMGTLAAIPPSVDVTTLGINTAAGLMLAHAAQDYGVYVVDRTGASANVFYGEQGISGTFITNVSTNFNLDRVRHALQVVTNNTQSTPGGGAYDGTATNRRAALATGL